MKSIKKSILFWTKKYLTKANVKLKKLCDSAITKNDIKEELIRLGVKKGDKIIVHSAMSKIGVLKDGASTFNETLKELIGDKGVIIMPTHSAHSSYRFLNDKELYFDVVNTISITGALTENFRKSPGVFRSLHPTHSVAVWGKDAQNYIKGHEKSLHPFDNESPYPRIISEDFKTIAIGVDLNSTTVVRAADDLFDEYPFNPYTENYYEKKCIDIDSNEIIVKSYAHKKDIKLFRDNMMLYPYVKSLIKMDKFFKADVMMFSSKKMYEAIVDLAKKGITTYKIGK